MYERFRATLAVNLSGAGIDVAIVKKVMVECDKLATHYKFERNDALITINDAAETIIKTFLVCKKMEGLSEGTLKNYAYAVNGFFSRARKLPNEVQANDIRAYLYLYQSERGCSDRSLDKVRQYLRLFFSWANSERYIESNPALTIKPIKYEIKPRTALSQIELEYIRKSAITAKEKAIVEVLYSTGCRRAELCGLKISDVDMAAGTVHLFGKGKKHRQGYLNAKALVALAAYLRERKGDSEYLFTNDRKPYGQMSGATLEKIVKRIHERTNVNRHVTPHVFRHTTATQALRGGMPIADIQKLLGHSNIATTMIYAETDQSNVQAEHLRFVV